MGLNIVGGGGCMRVQTSEKSKEKREGDKVTGGDESAVVLHSLVSASAWLFLLVLLRHFGSLSSHFTRTCERSVNLTYNPNIIVFVFRRKHRKTTEKELENNSPIVMNRCFSLFSFSLSLSSSLCFVEMQRLPLKPQTLKEMLYL